MDQRAYDEAKSNKRYFENKRDDAENSKRQMESTVSDSKKDKKNLEKRVKDLEDIVKMMVAMDSDEIRKAVRQAGESEEKYREAIFCDAYTAASIVANHNTQEIDVNVHSYHAHIKCNTEIEKTKRAIEAIKRSIASMEAQIETLERQISTYEAGIYQSQRDMRAALN